MSSALTGHRRYRRGWFGRLILQVQYRHHVEHPLGGHLEDRWRDARVTDFVSEEIV